MLQIDTPAPKKKPVNSKRKGANGERQLAKDLTALGYPATRGQQFKGGADSPDVVCELLRAVHWEVKVYKTCQMFSPAMLRTWDEQARADAGSRLPCIAHRWNGSRHWFVRVLCQERGPYWQNLEDFLMYAEHLK